MRLVVATVGMLLGAAILLPGVNAPTAVAQVAPSASVDPTGSSPPPNLVQVDLFDESNSPVGRTWHIAVAGGTAEPNVVTLDDLGAAFLVFFSGPSATVEMTVTLPPGWELKHGVCFFHDESVRRDVLAGPRRLVFEVFPNGDASCDYSVGRSGGATPPPTDSLGAQTGSSPDGWPMVLALMAAVIAASGLIAVRARLRS